MHGSLSNISDNIRWSFDLRYNPIGQDTGREIFPGFIARSNNDSSNEFRDSKKWKILWEETRKKMSKINQEDMMDFNFNQSVDCA